MVKYAFSVSLNQIALAVNMLNDKFFTPCVKIFLLNLFIDIFSTNFTISTLLNHITN